MSTEIEDETKTTKHLIEFHMVLRSELLIDLP